MPRKMSLCQLPPLNSHPRAPRSPPRPRLLHQLPLLLLSRSRARQPRPRLAQPQLLLRPRLQSLRLSLSPLPLLQKASPRRTRQLLWLRSSQPHRPPSLQVPLRQLPRLLSLRRHPRVMLLQLPKRSPLKHLLRHRSLPLRPLQSCPPSLPQSLLLACRPPVVLWMSLTLAPSRSQSQPPRLRLPQRLPPVLLRLQLPHPQRNRLALLAHQLREMLMLRILRLLSGRTCGTTRCCSLIISFP